VICFSGGIDPGEFENPHTAPRKSTRDAESAPAEIDANFQASLFEKIKRPFCSVSRANAGSGLEIRIGREMGFHPVNSRDPVNFTGMNY